MRRIFQIHIAFKILLLCLIIFIPQSSQAVEYDAIDQHALNTPKSAEQSIKSLAAYLIKPAKNELEKVRAIFRWVTANIKYDSEAFFSGNIGDQRPEDILKRRFAVCEGYAELFRALGCAAGLEVEKISGYAKGYGYTIGEQFDITNHAWNAVKIDGKWYLLDSTWGGGGFIGNHYVQKFDEHYFLTPPDQFIYTHFPENPKWQLSEKSVSKKEWEQIVSPDSEFFRFGLKIGSHSNAVIQTDNEVVITLIKSSTDPNFQLKAYISERDEDVNKLPVIEEKEGYFKIQASFPHSGNYLLKVDAVQRDGYRLTYYKTLEYRVEARCLPEKIKAESFEKDILKKISDNDDKNLILTVYSMNKDDGNYILRNDIKLSEKLKAWNILYPTGHIQKLSAAPIFHPTFKRHGGNLYSPTNYYLESRSIQKFKLTVPGAKKVVIIMGGKWFPLSKQSGELFEGEMTIQSREINVCGIFPDAGGCEYLLSYDSFSNPAEKNTEELIAPPITTNVFDEYSGHIYSPTNYYLKAQTRQKFKLRIPNAQEIAVFMGGRVIELTKKSEDFFEGEITIQVGKLGIYAKLPGSKHEVDRDIYRYVCLVEYEGVE